MNSSLDHNSLIPLYAQAEDLLRKMIKEPIYQEGKLLPNEIHMAKQLGISSLHSLIRG